MDKGLLLSIITINYNNLVGLQRTVESIINQTWREFEYIIIDGGSNDGSVDYIKNACKNFSYWVSETDDGIYDAMNKGVSCATGEYILFLNSGDYLINNNILTEVSKSLFGAKLIQFDLKLDTGIVVEHPKEISINFLLSNTLGHQALFSARELFVENKFDLKYKFASDWIWYFKLFLSKNINYKKVANIITIYDTNGVSSINNESVIKEKLSFINQNYSILSKDYLIIKSNKESFHKLRNNFFIRLGIRLGFLNKDDLIDYIY